MKETISTKMKLKETQVTDRSLRNKGTGKLTQNLRQM
jgi:hypothetical protein